MSRSQVGNVVERIRRQLDAAQRLEVNQLGANLDATETTITFTHALATSLKAGAILSVGRELMRVMSVEASPKTAVVMRGWQDSGGQVHADGDEVLISPRFTRFDIYDAMIAEIDSWEPKLFRVVSYEWTVTDETKTVELPASYIDAIGVVSVRRAWDTEDVASWPTMEYKTMRGAVGTWGAATTSGLLLRLLPHNGYMTAGTIHAELAVPFDVHTSELTEDQDFVDNYGLSHSMLEIVELGVKMRLLADAETGRSSRQIQDEPRRTEEVPAGSALTVAQTIRQNYNRRLSDEVFKLRNRYSLRSW